MITLPKSTNPKRIKTNLEVFDFALTVSVDGAKSTSHVKAGWIYYFKDWNAFALNFKETDIAPYKVYVIGEVSKDIENILAECGQNIEATIRK